ncbi:MAG: DUF1624 domain-containing protein [Bacilli bacterium]|nr:DUF1624 domain-containing protein [Bacilli bacterium]MBN2877133.1 DUF1624 domain-containing protein [Bacilli bacterium]
MKQKRIWELDFARGFAILMMVFDHLMYDLKDMDSYFNNFDELNRSGFVWLNQLAELYWNSTLRFYGHFFFVSVFLIVSGISFTFSKSNLARSLKLMGVAALISIITYLIEEFTGMNTFIIFGVIHMFGVSIFLTWLLWSLPSFLSWLFQKVGIKADPKTAWARYYDWFILLVGTFIIIMGIQSHFWQLRYISTIRWEDIPGLLYGTRAYGADYFGLFPYSGMIMIGTVIGRQFYANRVSLIPSVKMSPKNPVLFTGRNSLWVFVTHQFILFAIIFIIGYLFGYRF